MSTRPTDRSREGRPRHGAGQGRGPGVAEGLRRRRPRGGARRTDPLEARGGAADCPTGPGSIACDVGMASSWLDRRSARDRARWRGHPRQRAHHTIRDGSLLDVNRRRHRRPLADRSAGVAPTDADSAPHLCGGGVVINFGRVPSSPRRATAPMPHEDALAASPARRRRVGPRRDPLPHHRPPRQLPVDGGRPHPGAGSRRSSSASDRPTRQPADIGAAAVFLAGPARVHHPGQMLMVDAG